MYARRALSPLRKGDFDSFRFPLKKGGLGGIEGLSVDSMLVLDLSLS